jgi:hypothetical protein
VIDDEMLQEWASAADARISDLAQRLVGPGPKASHVSASECRELSEFVSDVALVALPALIAEICQLRAICLVGVPCARHGGAVHGHEAEELRAGIEKVLRDPPAELRSALRRLLDDVDARDSLTFLERGDASCR